MLAHQYGRYRFIRLPFGVAPEGDMFQQKLDEIFKDIPKIFGIEDDIQILEYDADGRDHKRTIRQVIKICFQDNLKLNKSNCHLTCMKIPFLGEAISREEVQINLNYLCC